MALGDLASVKVHLEAFGLVAESALGMQCISPFANWRDLLAIEFRGTVMPDWLACLGFNIALRDVTVADVVPGTGIDAVWSDPIPPTGTGGTFEAPAQCAYVISWRSDGIGRNTRGRNYLFGLPRDWLSTARRWNGDAFDAVENLVSVVLAQYGPTGFSDLARLQVISRGPHDAPLPVPTSYPITHAFFTNEIRTMRKRARDTA